MIQKHFLIIKYILQIFLYLLEVLGISYLLTFISDVFWQTENFIDFIERMTIFYTFYQITIFGILQQLNDMKKDEYLAILSMYKYEFIPNIFIKYELSTDTEKFEIEHKCAFINTIKTRLIPIQENSPLTK